MDSMDDMDDGTPDPGGTSPADRRPLGAWLRLVDALIDREIATAFEGEDASRGAWRLLNALSGDVDAPWIAERLARRGKLVRRLAERGWIAQDESGGWALTAEGRDERDRLAARVTEVRAKVASTLPPEEFAALIASLERLARGLGWDESQPMPRRGRRPGLGFMPGPGFAHGFGPWHGHGPWGERGFGPGPRHGFGPGAGRGFGPGYARGFGPGPGPWHERPHPHHEPEEHGCHCRHDEHCGHADAHHGHEHEHEHEHQHGHEHEHEHEHAHHRHAQRRAERAYERGFSAGFTAAKHTGDQDEASGPAA